MDLWRTHSDIEFRKFAVNKKHSTFKDFWFRETYQRLVQFCMAKVLALKFDRHLHHVKMVCIQIQIYLYLIFSWSLQRVSEFRTHLRILCNLYKIYAFCMNVEDLKIQNMSLKPLILFFSVKPLRFNSFSSLGDLYGIHLKEPPSFWNFLCEKIFFVLPFFRKFCSNSGMPYIPESLSCSFN